ncbi:hypothetical protein DFJ74DRAFT_711756 [Hyaloraphidium curvatum]|nr:hypothetical protein DFJ74DRAFT_711756 [Hyaloraphidium curvatum]
MPLPASSGRAALAVLALLAAAAVSPASAQQLCVSNVVSNLTVVYPASLPPLAVNVTLVGGGGGGGGGRGAGGGGGSTAIQFGSGPRFYAFGGDGGKAATSSKAGDGQRVTFSWTAMPGDAVAIKVGGGGGGGISASKTWRSFGSHHNSQYGVGGGGGGSGWIGGGGGSHGGPGGGGGESSGPLTNGAGQGGGTEGYADHGGNGGTHGDHPLSYNSGGVGGSYSQGGDNRGHGAGSGAGYGAGGGEGGGVDACQSDLWCIGDVHFYEYEGAAGGSSGANGSVVWTYPPNSNVQVPMGIPSWGAAAMQPTWTINPPAGAGKGAYVPKNYDEYNGFRPGYGGNGGYAILVYRSPDGTCPLGGSSPPSSVSPAQALAVSPPLADPGIDLVQQQQQEDLGPDTEVQRAADDVERRIGETLDAIAEGEYDEVELRAALIGAAKADAAALARIADVHARTDKLRENVLPPLVAQRTELWATIEARIKADAEAAKQAGAAKGAR